MTNTSKNFILTNHAEERMQLRRITHDMIAKTIQKPDERESEADGDIQFIRTLNKRQVHVVAKYLDDEGKWLVKSVWVRGEDDPKPLWMRFIMLPIGLLQRVLGRSKSKKSR
jgi:hypothetical protein